MCSVELRIAALSHSMLVNETRHIFSYLLHSIMSSLFDILCTVHHRIQHVTTYVAKCKHCWSFSTFVMALNSLLNSFFFFAFLFSIRECAINLCSIHLRRLQFAKGQH